MPYNRQSVKVQARVSFGEWLALTPAERVRAGMAATQKDWASQWGVTPRTVMRWKSDDPVVAEAYEAAVKRREEELRELPPEPVPQPQRDGAVDGDDGDGVLDLAEVGISEFDEIRRSLVEMAKKGQKEAINTYFNLIGKHELEMERRARESEFAGLSDEALIGEVLGLIGRDRVRVWLDQGEGERGTS